MLSNLKLRSRLGLAFGIVLLMTMAVGAAGYFGVNATTTIAVEVLETEVRLAELAGQAWGEALNLRVYEKDAFLNIEAADTVEEDRVLWQAEHDLLVETLEEMDPLLHLAEDIEAVRQMREGLAEYEVGFHAIIDEIHAGTIATPAAAKDAMEVYHDAMEELGHAAEAFELVQVERMEGEADIVRALDRTTALRVLGILGVAVLLSIGIVLLTSRTILRQVAEIGTVFMRVGVGDFTARAKVFGRDELGTLAANLNATFDNIGGLLQTQEEKDEMQQSISKLLAEISAVADGDLTVEAEVTAEMTGAIADSINFMLEQLREIISRVQETTLHVSSASSEIQATAEHLAQGSEMQSEQIINTSAAIDEMAVSINQVSESSASAATVADQAMSNARLGNEAVSRTVEGMSSIRTQVQETAKRIKRLGETSQEVGEIVQLIGDIADRTSILALNASIQAAMAGEAGRGFAVVAEEVERLADRSANATKRIENLIKTIQSETTEAVAAMEDTTHEVVKGSEVANEAGRALGEIEAVSNRLAELISSISLSSKQQARGSESVAKSMGDISDITQQTAAGTKQAAVSIRNLAVLADALRESVSTFRMPGKAA